MGFTLPPGVNMYMSISVKCQRARYLHWISIDEGAALWRLGFVKVGNEVVHLIGDHLTPEITNSS